MFKKTMKFDNLHGEPVEQTFYFNYKKKEVAELMEFGYVVQFAPKTEEERAKRYPLEEQLERLMTPVSESGLSQQENTLQAYRIFQNLILDAYGVKGADDVTFVKTDETRAWFESHVAFDDMIFEFINDEKLGAQFVEECLPPRFRAEAKKELEAKGGTPGASLHDLVAEAERRQKDPETRIEPGMDAAIAAGVATPEMAKVAEAVAVAASDDQAPVPVKKEAKDLTEEDILTMPEDDFKKLDPRELSNAQMRVAFRRKTSS